MNHAEIALIADEIVTWKGDPVVGAWQPSRDRVVIGIGSHQLLLVPRGPWARLHPIASRPKNPERPFSFQGALRARLHGRLTRVEKHAEDRIIDLWFGDQRLHVRLTGRSGGLWLTDGDRVVAAYDGPAPVALPEIRPQPIRPEAPRFTPIGAETPGRAAERYFAARESSAVTADRRAGAERSLKRRIDRLERLAEGLRDDLDKAAQAPRLRRMADALAANLHAIRRGASTADLADLEDPEIVHHIVLDPNRPAAVALDKLYKKAGRLDRVGDRVIDHLDRVEKDVAALNAALVALGSADDAALTAIERLAPTPKARAGAVEALPWHEWTGPHGQIVLVGRNERGNRRLTFQRARGHDWWMHLRGAPGAHLVIPIPKDHSPPLELLLAAGQIALQHARVPEGAAADVQYTRIRDVRSIPGEIGRVTVHGERVLRIVRDPAALVGWTHGGEDR